MAITTILSPEQLAAGVDLSLISPGSDLERLFRMYFANSDSAIKEALEARIETVLIAEKDQLDGFAQLLMASYHPDFRGDVSAETDYFSVESAYDKDGTIRENSRKLVMKDSDLPFESLIIDLKTVNSLIDKLRRKSGQPIKDHLRARILVENGNKNGIYDVKNHLDCLGGLATRLGMNYVAPTAGQIKDYTARPKLSGYGEEGVMHYPVLFSVPGEKPLRAMEIQIMTQEQAFQEARDSYHRDLKKEVVYQLAA